MPIMEREIEREAKEQTLLRCRAALAALPRNLTYARKMLGEAIQLLEGADPDGFITLHVTGTRRSS